MCRSRRPAASIPWLYCSAHAVPTVSDPSLVSERDEDSSASDEGSTSYTPPKLSEGLTAPLEHPREWFFLVENRLLIAGGFLAVLLALFFAVEMASSFSDQGLMPLFYVFGSLIGGNFTLITIVISISQLVVSQENGPLGDQHERMSNTMDVRDYTGEIVGRPTPVDPSAFLRKLVDATRRRAKALRDTVSDSDDDDLRAEVDEFTDSLTGNADEVGDQLDGAAFGTFDVLFAALNFNYGWKIFQVDRISEEHSDSLSAESERLLDELRTTLTMFGPAREHIKTLYFQWALVDLSRLIVYTAVPALFVAGCTLAFVGGGTIVGTTLGVTNLLWVVAGAFTLAVLPFLLLVSYIVRIATVAKRTLAIGPLILRDSQR